MARISHYRAQHIPTTGDQPQGTTARSYDSLADSQARSGGCKACLVTALCPVLLVVGHAHIAFVLRMPPVGFREYLQGLFLLSWGTWTCWAPGACNILRASTMFS